MNALTNHRYRAIWLVVGLCLIAAPSTVVLLGEDHPHSSSAAATTSAPATTRASERDKENEKRKQEEIQHPFLGEMVSIGLLFHVQALLLARHLRGDLDGYPPFIWK